MNKEIFQFDTTDEKVYAEEPLLITVEQACSLMNLGRNTMLKFTKIKGFPALILPRQDTYR